MSWELNVWANGEHWSKTWYSTYEDALWAAEVYMRDVYMTSEMPDGYHPTGYEIHEEERGA